MGVVILMNILPNVSEVLVRVESSQGVTCRSLLVRVNKDRRLLNSAASPYPRAAGIHYIYDPGLSIAGRRRLALSKSLLPCVLFARGKLAAANLENIPRTYQFKRNRRDSI